MAKTNSNKKIVVLLLTRKSINCAQQNKYI